MPVNLPAAQKYRLKSFVFFTEGGFWYLKKSVGNREFPSCPQHSGCGRGHWGPRADPAPAPRTSPGWPSLTLLNNMTVTAIRTQRASQSLTFHTSESRIFFVDCGILWHLAALVCPGGFRQGADERAAAVRSHQRGPGSRGANCSSVCGQGGKQGSGGARGETRQLEELPAVDPERSPHLRGPGWCQRRQTHRRPSFRQGGWRQKSNLFIIKSKMIVAASRHWRKSNLSRFHLTGIQQDCPPVSTGLDDNYVGYEVFLYLCFPSPFTLLFLIRASVLGSYMEQFETPEVVDHARLNCLQKWTEKRLNTFVITVPGEERDIYIPLCELALITAYLKSRKLACEQCLFIQTSHLSVYRWLCAVTGRWYSPPQTAAVG